MLTSPFSPERRTGQMCVWLTFTDPLEWLHATELVVHHFGSHLIDLHAEQHSLLAYLSPLDPRLFAPAEGLRFVALTVKKCIPFSHAEVRYYGMKRSFNK